MTIAKQELQTFTSDQLKEYVEKRLRGLINDPTYSPDRGEKPEDFLIASYEESGDEPFLARVRQAVLNLFLDENPEQTEPIYFSRLLHLIYFMEIYEAKPRLAKYLANQQLFAGKPSSRHDDLYIGVIQGALAFGQGREFLDKMVDLLGEPIYAPAAYNAICEMSAELAATYLADFAKAVKDRPVFLRDKLEDLQEVYGAPAIHRVWIRKKKTFPAEQVELVDFFMYQIPEFEALKPIELSPLSVKCMLGSGERTRKQILIIDDPRWVKDKAA